ncbi:hypothetical protein SDC9_188060 [bioreactor metagenome]|uniref:Uncharacterized protein n=1 Tax=bioreactor metagenome TaxID=1076179 RepID=A0A645HPZ0_9ZZZZ
MLTGGGSTCSTGFGSSSTGFSPMIGCGGCAGVSWTGEAKATGGAGSIVLSGSCGLVVSVIGCWTNVSCCTSWTMTGVSRISKYQ